MTIEKHAGMAGLFCDDCGDPWPETVADTDIDVLRTDAKAAGWRWFKSNGQWQCACAGCVARWADAQQGQGGLF